MVIKYIIKMYTYWLITLKQFVNFLLTFGKKLKETRKSKSFFYEICNMLTQEVPKDKDWASEVETW